MYVWIRFGLGLCVSGAAVLAAPRQRRTLVAQATRRRPARNNITERWRGLQEHRRRFWSDSKRRRVAVDVVTSVAPSAPRVLKARC